MNTKAYYKLTSKRYEIEEHLEPYNIQIEEFRKEAKKLKKGSAERQKFVKMANDLVNSLEYQKLQVESKTLNYCINTFFYLSN